MAQTKKEKSLQKSKFYHRQFRDIPPMSSSELLKWQQEQEQEQQRSGLMASAVKDEEKCSTKEQLIIIDVRSEAERSVSMIPGAVSLSSFKKEIVSSQSLPPDAYVVVYCTIGYRSGMEARRLRQLYPSLKGRLYNLDGIVSYTHASSTREHNEEVHNTENQPLKNATMAATAAAPPKLIDPKTNEATNRVHTYGPSWDCVDDHFETTHFSLPSLFVRTGEVGLLTVKRNMQRLWYNGRRLCTMCVDSKKETRTGTTITESEMVVPGGGSKE